MGHVPVHRVSHSRTPGFTSDIQDTKQKQKIDKAFSSTRGKKFAQQHTRGGQQGVKASASVHYSVPHSKLEPFHS